MCNSENPANMPEGGGGEDNCDIHFLMKNTDTQFFEQAEKIEKQTNFNGTVCF
jgi:hypothetical protein